MLEKFYAKKNASNVATMKAERKRWKTAECEKEEKERKGWRARAR